MTRNADTACGLGRAVALPHDWSATRLSAGPRYYLPERCLLSSEAEVSDLPKMSQRALG